MAKRQYQVVIEPSATGYGAYVPNVPSCVAVGKTRAEVEQRIHDALESHLEMMIENGEPLLDVVSEAITVDVRLPAARAG